MFGGARCPSRGNLFKRILTSFHLRRKIRGTLIVSNDGLSSCRFLPASSEPTQHCYEPSEPGIFQTELLQVKQKGQRLPRSFANCTVSRCLFKAIKLVAAFDTVFGTIGKKGGWISQSTDWCVCIRNPPFTAIHYKNEVTK